MSSSSRRSQLLHELHHYSGASPSSPHIVQFLGAFYHSGAVRMALEYMDRGCLQSLLRAHGALPEALVQDLMHQALLGLAELHAQRKLHRDVKPATSCWTVTAR